MSLVASRDTTTGKLHYIAAKPPRLRERPTVAGPLPDAGRVWFRSPELVSVAAAMFTRHVVPERRMVVGRLLDDSDPRATADWRDPEHAFWGGERIPESTLQRVLDSPLTPAVGDRRRDRVYDRVNTDREQVEGPRWRIEVSPGTVKVTRRDPVRWDRARERAREAGRKRARVALAAAMAEPCHDGCLRASCAGCRARDGQQIRADFIGVDGLDVFRQGAAKIGVWSTKSRAVMRYRLSTLDYAPLFVDAFGNNTTPAMVTLTYPGDWRAVAPSNEAVRRHVRLLEKRWNREWGVWADETGTLRANPFVALWKREFQARGAPHYHYLVAPPESPDFPQWLSETWADIVSADWCGHACWTVWKGGDNYVEVAPAGKGDPCCERGRHVMAGTGIDFHEGARAVDPRRLAVYFAKHGAYGVKEYQNEAPAEWLENGGAGRFWGVIGLSAAVAAVEVDPVTAQAVARILRRLEYSKRYRQQLRILRCKCHTRVDKTTGELPAKHRQACFRWNTVVVRRFRGSLGYVVVNDAPALAAGLARAVERSAAGHGIRRSGGPPLGFLP